MDDKDRFRDSKIMTKEEEEEMEALRQRRGRGMAFYDKQGPPMERETLNMAPTHASGLSFPDSTLVNKRIMAHSTRLRVGFADTIGKRPTMEDEIVIQGKLRGKEDEDFVAVYDGHGGRAASEFAAKHLHTVLAQKLEEFGDPEESLKQAFIATNDMMRRDSITGGTTALVALFLQSKCYIANAGDSRAVLSRDGKAYRMSKDHKPEDPVEEARVIKAGGTVLKINNTKLGKIIGRVNGMLSVSRALGDLFLQPYVTPVPEVKKTDVSSKKNDLLILACDGLWDVITDDEAVTIANSESDPEKSALKLRDAAVAKNSADNISVVVIRLPPDNCAPEEKETTKVKAAFIAIAAMVFLFGFLKAGRWLSFSSEVD